MACIDADTNPSLQEVLARARAEDVTLTEAGEETFALVPIAEYRTLKQRKPSMKELLMRMNFDGVDLERDQTPARDVDL